MNLLHFFHNLQDSLALEEEPTAASKFEIKEKEFDLQIFELVESQISYWAGLRSKEVWLKGLISSLLYILPALIILINLNYNEEINYKLKVFLSIVLYIWAGNGFYQFHLTLRLYQLYELRRQVWLAHQKNRNAK